MESTKIRIPLDPQPKYGLPFQIVGDTTQRFYNGNPSYPKLGPMFSYSWRAPSTLNPNTVSIEKVNGIYEWVGDTQVSAEEKR